VTFLNFQMEIVERYHPLLDLIGARVGDLEPFDLLLVHGAICGDILFASQVHQVREEWEAAHPELTSSQKQLAGVSVDFPRMAALRLTAEEKRALKVRVGLP
jgi:hypothetical protein